MVSAKRRLTVSAEDNNKNNKTTTTTITDPVVSHNRRLAASAEDRKESLPRVSPECWVRVWRVCSLTPGVRSPIAASPGP